MGRARRGPIRRLEFTHFRSDDPVLAELEDEAGVRGVSVQQHIYDLLRARYLARRGHTLGDLLWVPPTPTAQEKVSEPDPAPDQAARAAAGAWLDLLEG
jgi:hypothetical protein